MRAALEIMQSMLFAVALSRPLRWPIASNCDGWISPRCCPTGHYYTEGGGRVSWRRGPPPTGQSIAGSGCWQGKSSSNIYHCSDLRCDVFGCVKFRETRDARVKLRQCTFTHVGRRGARGFILRHRRLGRRSRSAPRRLMR